MSIQIEVVRTADEDLVNGVRCLLPQLSKSAHTIDKASLERLIRWQGIRLLVARVRDEIVGTLTLVTFPIPTGLRAWIEDVVVDQAARGQGVGAALTLEAIRLAQLDGARTVDLTSRPSRGAAHRLYSRLGFEIRDSKVYRFEGPE